MVQGIEYVAEDEYSVNLEPKRYRIAFIFSLAQITTAIIYPVLNPIMTSISEIYDVPVSIISLSAMLYLLMHPISSIPVNNIIASKGLKVGISLGGIFLMVGTLMRCLINYSFGWVITGFIIAGIGRPFIMNSQGKVPLNWFESSQRLAVTSVLSFCNTVFAIIGFLIPGFMFNGYKIEDDRLNGYKQGREKTESLMLIEAIITCVFMMLNIIFIEAKPKEFPSHAAKLSSQIHDRSNDASQEKPIVKLFRQKDFVKLWVCFGIFYGSFIVLGVAIANLTQPYEFENKEIQNAILGAVPGFSGMIGSIFMTGYVKRTKKYKKCLLFSMIGTAVNISLFPVYLEMGYTMGIIGSMINGILLIPVIPIMLDFACEIVFPIGEEHAMGIMIAGGQIWGFLFGFIVTTMLAGKASKGKTYVGAAFIVVMNLIGVYICFQIKEILARSKNEESLRSASMVSDSGIEPKERVFSMQEALINSSETSADSDYNK